MAAYFGDPGITGDTGGDLLPLFDQLRQRKAQDLQAQSDMAVMLPIRQERMRALIDPLTGMGRTTNNLVSTGISGANTQMNTVLKEDMSPQEKANLQLKKNDQELERQKIAQTGKIGEERIGVQTAQEKLNQQKSDQIHQQKIDDLQRKVEDSNNKLGLSYDKLQQNASDNSAHLQFLRDKADADSARHALDTARLNSDHESKQQLNQATIDHLNAQIDALKNPKTETKTTEVNPEGTKKTETTTKSNKNPAFNSNTTQRFQSKDGSKTWNIPMDKLDSFKKDNPDAQSIESR